MKRRFYCWLLRLHPRWFRDRYGDEMLWIYDESGGRGRLFADAAASVVRQWAFRSDPDGAAAATPDGAPLFHTLESSLPRPAALVQGLLLSVAVFLALAALIPHGGRRVTLAAGRAWDAAWQRVSAAAHMSPGPVLFREQAQVAPISLALGPLDPDRDDVMSPEEIAAAPAALGSPQAVGAPPSGAVRINLALVLLDTDGDGRLSTIEIARATAALRAADSNGDGRLEWSEIVPPDVAEKLAVLLGADLDGDRRISRRESAANFPAGLFDRADRNRDGFVTGEELLAELR